MIKPLLRTLPILSGNVKLACSLSDYKRMSDNRFSSTVRIAKLLPLTSILSQRNIEANLLTSTYDFDLKRYFKYYSQYFFDDVFEYDKKNYIQIDKSDSQKNRNTDFEFGCKRISYSKNETQFAFYTPIYIDSLNDLPDYFRITIKLTNNKYSIEKEIDVKLKSNYKYNYLYTYLKNYLSKIDSNVIFCNTGAKQATYYGIDLLKGGFTKVVDFVISDAYTQQNTINNFDSIISNGFSRNNIAIRQILPLCWYFNINDILNDDEKKKFKNSTIFISGNWYKDEKPLNFYDIDTNYQYYYDNPYLLNSNNGIFSYKNTGNNILDMEYPSLNESKYINYRYTNKLSKKYNRWKLKYSSDEHPYITNLSPAFSINQNSIYRYGTYPTNFVSMNVITNINNDILIPIGNALKSEKSPYYNDYNLVNNYINTLNNNVSTWYDLEYENISDIYNKDIWENVEDNKIYYKGILYDLNKIYEEYPSLTGLIDKFSVIVNLHFNKLKEKELNNIKKVDFSIFNSNKYITDKNCWVSERVNDGLSSGEFEKIPFLFNTTPSLGNGNAQIVFDKLYIKDDHGDFIDLLSLGYNIYDVNKYYKYSDIIKNFQKYYIDDIASVLNENSNFERFFIDGYELLPIGCLKNILHENGRNILFEGKEECDWILDNLYFSQHGNYYKTHYDRDTFISLVKDYGEDKYLIPLFLKSKFISYSYLIDILYDHKDLYNVFNNYVVNDLIEYRFYPKIKDETSAIYASDLFIKRNLSLGDNYGNYIPSNKIDNDVIYVDTYNLNNVIRKYNKRYNSNIKELTNSEHIQNFGKFLNMKHLLYYISDLYKDEDSNTDLSNLFNSLYIKKRVIDIEKDIENLEFGDIYIPFYSLYDNMRLISNDEKIEIINGIENDKYNYIFKKVNNHYSPSSYQRVDDIDSELYFYVPEFYILINNEYISIVDYLRSVIESIDPLLLEYATREVLYKLETTNINDIDINSLELGGMRRSSQRIGFNKNQNTNINTIKDNLTKINEIINTYISSKKENIYYKDIANNEFIKYQNYTGINDYILLDDVNIKTSILEGRINLLTYIINEDGEFIRKDYLDDDYYIGRSESDDDYNSFKSYLISEFASDVQFIEGDNYFKFSEHYFKTHNVDALVNIPDLDGIYNSKFTFEVVYKKDFIKLNKNIYDLIGLENKNIYKDLYLYRVPKYNEYPSSLRIYLNTSKINDNLKDITNYLIPLFDDIFLQEKEYTVIYSEYNQANIYEVKTFTDYNYRYNQTDITCMYDISNLPVDKEYEIGSIDTNIKKLAYTYDYYWKLKSDNDPRINNHEVLPTYKLLDNCYSTISNYSDSLGIYDKFKINTYTSSYVFTYSYSYTKSEIETINSGNTSYTVINKKEYTGIGEDISYTTYGFILIDAYIDNTNCSFNIIDEKYKKKKYFTSINGHNIYDSNYNISDTFNLLVPFSNLKLLDDLSGFNKVIIKPKKYDINTYYKQSPIINDNGYTYAYTINYNQRHIDTLSLERYFDSIIPNIQKTNVLESTYCLKYKDYKYTEENPNYLDDIFYNENINIYDYNKIRIYHSDKTFSLFEPVEYKHLNNNKLINLEEEFEIEEVGKFTYSELIEKENEKYVFEKFKKHILLDKLNTYDDNQILFLFNRYSIKYDTVCIGLNNSKTEKLYTLKYKFNLL